MKTKIEIALICVGAFVSVCGIAAMVAVQNVHDYMMSHWWTKS